MDSLSKAAHALKGPLLNLGLNDLSNIARHIELNAKSEKDTLQNSKNHGYERILWNFKSQ